MFMDLSQFNLSHEKMLPLKQLMSELGFDQYFNENIILTGSDPILRSPHRLGEAVSFVLLLDAIGATVIWKFRTKQKNDIKLNICDAIHYLHPVHFIWQSGYKIHLGAETVPTNGLFECADGRIVMIESGPPYKKLENGYLNFFNCGNNKEAIGKTIRQKNSFELQETLSDLGLPCCIAYTKEEWSQHPQGKILTHTPNIEIEKIATGSPVGFSKNAGYPLSGVRVLDYTHVLAGPKSTRTLAEFGADVLHISSPYHRDTLAQNFAVNPGKRSAYLDINDKKDMKQMLELISDADIFANSYRPSVVEKFELTPLEVVKHSKKGLIYLSINAYGHEGPWKKRPGFDQNGQVATGFAVKEGSIKAPKFSPVFYLADLITAYFAAAGMMAALLRRATEGGSYHVKVSLAKSAMWVQELGYVEDELFQKAPEEDNYPVNLMTEATPYGPLTYLRPAVQFSNMPKVQLRPVAPFGAHKAVWE